MYCVCEWGSHSSQSQSLNETVFVLLLLLIYFLLLVWCSHSYLLKLQAVCLFIRIHLTCSVVWLTDWDWLIWPQTRNKVEKQPNCKDSFQISMCFCHSNLVEIDKSSLKQSSQRARVFINDTHPVMCFVHIWAMLPNHCWIGTRDIVSGPLVFAGSG